MPWECFECTFVQEGSPSGRGPCIMCMHDNPLRIKVEVEDAVSGRGPCIMCMHDNPLRIKVEVEDAGASPSPALKITGTNVKMKDLMSDVASLKAFAEALS